MQTPRHRYLRLVVRNDCADVWLGPFTKLHRRRLRKTTLLELKISQLDSVALVESGGQIFQFLFHRGIEIIKLTRIKD